MTGMVRAYGWTLRTVRTSIECTVVVTGWLLGGTVGVVTLVFALAIGPLVHWLLPLLVVQTADHGPDLQ